MRKAGREEAKPSERLYAHAERRKTAPLISAQWERKVKDL